MKSLKVGQFDCFMSAAGHKSFTLVRFSLIHTRTKFATKRLTAIGGVTIDFIVAGDVSYLTFHQDQTLLNPNENI